MDRNFKKLIVISIIILLCGGFGALLSFWDAILQVIVAFFPFFFEVGKMALEDYLTSPYFIVSVIMAIGSAIGIYFSYKGGKILFWIVSIICEVASLVSILSNIIQII